jgi:hypothetical protein
LNNPLHDGLVRVCASGRNPEKLISGIHKAIVSESQYFRALGKNKYYMYYRCIKHSNINISGTLVHQKFQDLLKHISFTPEFLAKLIERVTSLAKETLEARDQRHKILAAKFAAIETKIENIENKLFDGVINDTTFKKGMKKFSAEKAQLKDEYNFLDTMEGHLHQELLVLPYMLNLPQIFRDSTIGQQHAIIKQVFKQGLTFKGGMFRTPCINPEFEVNLLNIKEKGLLFVEQSFDFSLSFPLGGGRGIRT